MEKISVGILTYNHEHFIEKCLNSVFKSRYPNLEIIISDDASQDRTVEVIQRFLDLTPTQHQVIFNVNKTNLGIASHFNLVFKEIATGELLITLGGDDMIKEDYFESAVQYFKQDENLMMLDFSADIIDGQDRVMEIINLPYDKKEFNLTNYLVLESIHSFAPGRMIRSKLVTQLEGLSKYCPTEDSVLVLRALMLGKLMRLNKSVILYRRHGNNLSSAANLKSMTNARIISQYFRDAIDLYDQKLLDDGVIACLFDRINYQYRIRQFSYNTKQSQLIKRIRLQLMKLWYVYFGRIKV